MNEISRARRRKFPQSVAPFTANGKKELCGCQRCKIPHPLLKVE